MTYRGPSFLQSYDSAPRLPPLPSVTCLSFSVFSCVAERANWRESVGDGWARSQIMDFFMYDIQHCFICRPSDSTVSEDAEIEPRTVATIRHWLSDALITRLDLVQIIRQQESLALYKSAHTFIKTNAIYKSRGFGSGHELRPIQRTSSH
jgi:hypothetical protein